MFCTSSQGCIFMEPVGVFRHANYTFQTGLTVSFNHNKPVKSIFLYPTVFLELNSSFCSWWWIKGCQRCCIVQPSLTCRVVWRLHMRKMNYVQLTSRNWTGSSLEPFDFLVQLLPSVDWIKMISFCMLCLHDCKWPPIAPSRGLHLPAPPPSFLIFHSVCSAHPAVVLATGTVWSCARAGRVGTCCQNLSVLNMVVPPRGCAVTFSAALPLSGWQVLGER